MVVAEAMLPSNDVSLSFTGFITRSLLNDQQSPGAGHGRRESLSRIKAADGFVSGAAPLSNKPAEDSRHLMVSHLHFRCLGNFDLHFDIAKVCSFIHYVALINVIDKVPSRINIHCNMMDP